VAAFLATFAFSMKVSVSYREVWGIAWPIMLSSLASTVINFTDVAFVARVGEKELAASALGGVFYFVLVMVGMAVGIGAQIMMARKAGEENPFAIGRILDHTIVLLLGLAVFMLFLVYALMPWLMHTIIGDVEVAHHCVDYLKARGWGLFFMMLLIAFRCFYTSIATTRIITYTTVTMMSLNIVLNYFLTLGHGGFPAMGIIGSGYASAISEGIAAVYAVIYTFVRHANRSYGLFRWQRHDIELYKSILQLSSPIVLQHIVSMGAWFFFFLMIGTIGTRELAVSNVVRSIYMVLMTPVWGFSQAANSMVSNLIGQNKSHEFFNLLRKIISLSMITSIIFTLICVIFPETLFELSSADTSIMQEAMPSFYIISIGTILFSVSMILLSAISGTGKTKAAMVIELINIFIYTLYVVIFTVVIPSSVEVVWGAEIFYWLLMGILSYFYLKGNYWKTTAL
jgi:putative MATE family efflux protein